jgi:hypothetical protein
MRDNREALDAGAAAPPAHETLSGEDLPRVKAVRVG